MEIKIGQYLFSHGKRPRGYGSWAIKVDGKEEIIWKNGTITEIAREMRRSGATSIEILP
jgi:hypothetical protein